MKDAILAYLRSNHPAICRHWFDHIELLNIDAGTVDILVTEDVQLRYLQRCCVSLFTEAVQSVTGQLIGVRFLGPDDISHNEDAPLVTDSPRSSVVTVTGHSEMLLSPDYTFDSFVVGPGNRLAHAASVAVGRQPGRAYNPLFIHGGVGLGKTHLLQAICQEAMRNNPDFRIYYTSCNGFMTQFIEAVQVGCMTDFRHRFRNYDLLLIDDIHDLSNRGPSQEEFFHTFNALYQAGKQIVLSSDAVPVEIPQLEERLTSRFNCGLVANVEVPCFETRVEIIKRKSLLRQIDIPEDVSGYIAARIDGNIRELEGALTKIQSLALLNNGPINLDLAKAALGTTTSGRSSQPPIQTIIDSVTGYYGIRLSDLMSRRRQKSIALPRQIGMWLARRHTRFSLEEIGGYFGGRDHTTVLHAIRSIDARRESDDRLDQELSQLESGLEVRDELT